MLFGFQLHTCKLTRQLRTAYWLLVHSLDSRPVWTSSLSRLGNTMWEKVCVSQSTCGCPMHICPYTVHMLQGKHASMHRVLPGACCWTNWYGVISRFRLLWCMLQLQREDRMGCIMSVSAPRPRSSVFPAEKCSAGETGERGRGAVSRLYLVRPVRRSNPVGLLV